MILVEDTDDDIYSFWLLTSSIQGRYLSDKEIKHLKAREGIYSAVIHCILDKGMCFSTALAERREQEQKFFKEYNERNSSCIINENGKCYFWGRVPFDL